MLQIAINNEKKCPDFESIPLENYNINLKNVQRMMDNRLYIKFKHEDKKSQSFSEESARNHHSSKTHEHNTNENSLLIVHI